MASLIKVNQVARCGDCLYWHVTEADSENGDTGGDCRVRAVDRYPFRAPQHWCGEFEHRVMGPQYSGSEPGFRLVRVGKQWRFPTEPE